jgi:lysophospholipid acyltransferase (LPLAT)-like uncharacterized protein
MKIRNPVLLNSLGFTTAWVVRAWLATLQYRHCSLDSRVDSMNPQAGGPWLWTCWHENLLIPLVQHGETGACMLVSQHADGTFIAGVLRQMGYRVVRGSSTRGGIDALQQLIRVARKWSIAITPDGPRGPRRRVQPGLVFLAARTGLPVLPVGIGYRRASRLNTWDRLALPWPGTRSTCVVGAPIDVPAATNRRQLEDYRRLAEERLNDVTARAETWAQTGVRPAAAAGPAALRRAG